MAYPAVFCEIGSDRSACCETGETLSIFFGMKECSETSENFSHAISLVTLFFPALSNESSLKALAAIFAKLVFGKSGTGV